jgi:hypothetical protein
MFRHQTPAFSLGSWSLHPFASTRQPSQPTTRSGANRTRPRMAMRVRVRWRPDRRTQPELTQFINIKCGPLAFAVVEHAHHPRRVCRPARALDSLRPRRTAEHGKRGATPSDLGSRAACTTRWSSMLTCCGRARRTPRTQLPLSGVREPACSIWTAARARTGVSRAAGRGERGGGGGVTGVIPGEIWPTTFSTHLRLYQPQLWCTTRTWTGEFSIYGVLLRPLRRPAAVCWPPPMPSSTSSTRPPGTPSCCRAATTPSLQVQGGPIVPQNIYRMGMEVLTVRRRRRKRRQRREIVPDPVDRFLANRAVMVKGFMFWHMEKMSRHDQPPRGLLRLHLADVEFRVIDPSGSLDPAFDDTFMLDVGVRRRAVWLTSRTREP